MHDFEPNLPEQTDISTSHHHTGNHFAPLNQCYDLVFSLNVKEMPRPFGDMRAQIYEARTAVPGESINKALGSHS